MSCKIGSANSQATYDCTRIYTRATTAERYNGQTHLLFLLGKASSNLSTIVAAWLILPTKWSQILIAGIMDLELFPTTPFLPVHTIVDQSTSK